MWFSTNPYNDTEIVTMGQEKRNICFLAITELECIC